MMTMREHQTARAGLEAEVGRCMRALDHTRLATPWLRNGGIATG